MCQFPRLLLQGQKLSVMTLSECVPSLDLLPFKRDGPAQIPPCVAPAQPAALSGFGQPAACSSVWFWTACSLQLCLVLDSLQPAGLTGFGQPAGLTDFGQPSLFGFSFSVVLLLLLFCLFVCTFVVVVFGVLVLFLFLAPLFPTIPLYLVSVACLESIYRLVNYNHHQHHSQLTSLFCSP